MSVASAYLQKVVGGVNELNRRHLDLKERKLHFQDQSEM